MLGWIMPEPLAIAPRVTVFPASSMLRASSFFIVSVVRIASRASIEPAFDSPGDEGLHARFYRRHVERDSDDARRGDDDVLGPDRQPLGDQRGHAPRRRDSRLAVAGVRVARVDDDGLGIAVGEVLPRDDEGLADDLVPRIDGRRGAARLRPDEGQVLLVAGLLDSGADARREKPPGAVTPPRICFIRLLLSP